jgi:hypothetical protein
MKSTYLALAAGALSLSIASQLHAQGTERGAPGPNAAIQQAERFQQRQELTRPRFRESVPTLYEGEVADVGPQYVVMPAAERRKWIELAADSQFYYTSNVFLTEKGNIDSTLAVHTLQAGFAPSPWDVAGGQLGVRAGYRHQFFRYGDLTSNEDQLNNLNFDVSTIYSQVRYRFMEHWTATLGVDWNRYLGVDDDRSEFYVEVLPYWSLERQIQFSENSLLSIGYTGNYHATRVDFEPKDLNDRTDQILTVIYSHKLGEKLVLQPYYRLQYTRYDQNTTDTGGRHEWLNTLGVSATYFFTPWASVRAFVSYDVRDSTDPIIQDYHKWDSGGGVSLAFTW